MSPNSKLLTYDSPFAHRFIYWSWFELSFRFHADSKCIQDFDMENIANESFVGLEYPDYLKKQVCNLNYGWEFKILLQRGRNNYSSLKTIWIYFIETALKLNWRSTLLIYGVPGSYSWKWPQELEVIVLFIFNR